MAKSKSLTVLTVMSSIFALQACSEGITSAEEALSNLSNQTSSEATDPPEISIGAANPTGTETTIPITPSLVSNYIVNNFSVLPVSSLTSSPDEELESDNGTPPDTDSEVVTDPIPETDPEVVTDPPPDTDPEVVTDPPPDTDSEIVTDIEPETEEKEVANVDYTPIPEAPSEGELVPFGSTIQFAWSIPVALFGTVTGFDIAIADASEGIVSYRDNGVSVSSCNNVGLCTHQINSADLPIPEGDNIWTVSSLGENVSLNIAEATFTLDENLDAQIAGGLSILSPAAGYVADSSSVDFAWEDLSKPDAVYDLHVYSDAARTQKVIGTDGVVFDTRSIGTANSHTFGNDPSDGAKRYGLLLQWDDDTYSADSKEEKLFEYTSHTKVNTKVESPDSDSYDTVKGMIDAEWLKVEKDFTMKTMWSSDGYFAAPILQAAGLMFRTTGDTSYLDVGIRIGQSYIDSGKDMNGDGYLDWMNDDGTITDYNKYHHEWRAAMGVASVLIEMNRTGYTNGRPTRIAEWHQFLKVQVLKKWAPGHKQTNPSGTYMSNTATKGLDFVGRIATINIAVDQTHATPGNNEYFDWLHNPSSPFGIQFATYINLINSGKYIWPSWSNNARPDKITDTSHVNDSAYPILLGAVMGYTFLGNNDVFFNKMEEHFNYNWFPTSAGFKSFTDGSGDVNGWTKSSANSLALTAAFSPELKARWLDMFFNHEPTNGFYSNTRYNPRYAVLQGAGLLWALNGGKL